MGAAFAASATLQKEAPARRHSEATWTRPWPRFPQTEHTRSVPIKKSAHGRLQLLRYAGWLLAREHQMRRRVRRGALDDAKAQLAQVQAGEERFPLPQHDRRKGQVHVVD